MALEHLQQTYLAFEGIIQTAKSRQQDLLKEMLVMHAPHAKGDVVIVPEHCETTRAHGMLAILTEVVPFLDPSDGKFSFEYRAHVGRHLPMPVHWLDTMDNPITRNAPYANEHEAPC